MLTKSHQLQLHWQKTVRMYYRMYGCFTASSTSALAIIKNMPYTLYRCNASAEESTIVTQLKTKDWFIQLP